MRDNQVSKEITANQVKIWPKNGKISSGKLSLKYAILKKIGASNWAPITHSSNISTGLAKFIFVVSTKTKMNIGQYVFEQTVKHAKTDAEKCPIAFPTLLCGIMLDQHPSLITAIGNPEKRESPVTLHPKLFSANQIPDIVGTSRSVPTAGTTTKEQIGAALKETCIMLDKRKAQFEIMIQSIEIEDATAEDEPEDDEGGDTDGADNEDERNKEDSGNNSEEAE